MVEKKTVATKEATKRTTTKKPAQKAIVLDLSPENVGFKAGDVYNALAAEGEALSVSEIAKIAKISSEEAYLGIGWLLKEGKIQNEDNKIALA